MTRTALYRHWDADGALLYVGISSDPVRRMAEHRSASDWAHDVADTAIKWFDGREEAVKAEAQAICEEKPLHNIAHGNGGDVASVVAAIGRNELGALLGVKYSAIGMAVAADRFPASWYLVVSEICEERGIECPMDLFHWKRASEHSQ